MSPEWRAELEAAVGPVARVTSVGGGDINEAHCAVLADGSRVFVKSHAAPPPGMFAAEAHGLGWLAAGPLRVPRVIAHGHAFLALEWLELGGRRDDAALGRALAQLHAVGAPGFGLDRGNYLATIAQDNMPASDVATFYVERRLRPLVRTLRAHSLETKLDALLAAPARFGPPEPPARLHGDLWWGNVGFAGGAPVIFDPAVYGAHREIDLAMLALFGGVSDTLVSAYHEVYPLEPEWRTRVTLWQLYPIAAHAVLFGGGYTSQLGRMLDVVTTAHGR
ncbi:MAG: fructosamine kinase family protein [Myxococcales bacterium]|nr:fructosamine kinase family protein [Myxococcales bacterium]